MDRHEGERPFPTFVDINGDSASCAVRRATSPRRLSVVNK
jgi:hypothetical protein